MRVLFLVDNPAQYPKASVLAMQTIMILASKGVNVYIITASDCQKVHEPISSVNNNDYDLFAVVGDDLSFCRVLENSLELDIPVALINAGKHKSFQRQFHIPQKPRDIAEMIIRGSTLPLDAIRIGEKIIFTSASIGFDSRFFYFLDMNQSDGVIDYMEAVSMTASTFEPNSVKLEYEGGIIDINPFFLGILNIGYSPYGLSVSSSTSCSDGLIDVVYSESRNFVKTLYELPFGRKKFLPGSSDLKSFQCERIAITPTQTTLFRIETEFTRINKRIMAQILPRPTWIRVPPR